MRYRPVIRAHPYGELKSAKALEAELIMIDHSCRGLQTSWWPVRPDIRPHWKIQKIHGDALRSSNRRSRRSFVSRPADDGNTSSEPIEFRSAEEV